MERALGEAEQTQDDGAEGRQQHLQLQDGDHARSVDTAAQVDGQVEQPGQAEGEAEERADMAPVWRESGRGGHGAKRGIRRKSIIQQFKSY